MAIDAGASVASYLLQPKASISLGASGAVFGLFAVSVLVKLSFNPKKLIECGILGQFVIKQLLQVGVVHCLCPLFISPVRSHAYTPGQGILNRYLAAPAAMHVTELPVGLHVCFCFMSDSMDIF